MSMTMSASRRSAAPCARSRPSRLVCHAAVPVQQTLVQRCGLMLATASATLCIAASPALAGNVDFAAPANGSILSSPVHVEFEVKGMTVRPAADGPISGTGHFHLIIDDGPTPKGVALPFDATHVHYGKGQIQADVELTPGPHVLTLQFADSNHVSYGLAYSSEVKVVVE